MAWVTPQEFVAGEVLTAAKLNQLVDAIAFLNGLSAGPLPPFLVQFQDESADTYSYALRHRSRYLHLVYWSNGANLVKITVSGTLRYTDNNPPSGYNDVVLDMNSYGLTVGDFITIDVQLDADPGLSLQLLYLTELATDTALV